MTFCKVDIDKLKLGDDDELNKYEKNNFVDYDIHILVNYFVNIKNKNKEQLNALGYLYYRLKDYNNAYFYYKILFNMGDITITGILGDICLNLKDYNNALYYSNIAIDNS